MGAPCSGGASFGTSSTHDLQLQTGHRIAYGSMYHGGRMGAGDQEAGSGVVQVQSDGGLNGGGCRGN